MIERRRFKRVEAKVPVRCRIVHRKKKLPFSVEITLYTRNISQGGLLLSWPRGWGCKECSHCLAWIFNLNCKLKEEPCQETTRFLNPTTFLGLEIESHAFPGSIKTTAKVVWVKEPQSPQEDTYNVGIAFAELLKSKILP